MEKEQTLINAAIMRIISIYTVIIFFLPLSISAQNEQATFNNDSLVSAARQMIASTPFCTLISMDTTGHPNARTMDPFSPDDNFVVWFGTNKNSQKVKEIKRDSRVTIFYGAPKANGYTILYGNAYVIDDAEKKRIFWKKDWEQFYPENKENYILIKVVPNKLKILDYAKGINSDSITWKVPSVELDSEE